MPNHPWRVSLRFGVELGRRLSEDRCTQVAGSLTYTTLLALVPLLTVLLALSTALPLFDHVLGVLQDYVLDNFLPDAAGLDMLAEQLNEFTARAAGVRTIGTAVLALTAFALMHTIDDALNRIFRVQRKRHLAQRLMTYVAVLTLGPLLMGLSVTMTSYLVVDSLGALDLDSAAESVLRLLPFLFTWAALALLYIAVPNRPVAFRHAAVGAVVATLVFEGAKRGFALFVTKAPTYTVIYGTFATIMLFLLWLYISWLVVLAGATLTAMLPEHGGRRIDVLRT